MIGEDMGNLIGKRGQTLDSLQYLTSLVVNKNHEEYIRVKLDTENYRERRKETLESLAKNIAFKVKRTKRPVKLEPMNPYERRIIHSTLQGDKYVYTKSEGEEPYRHVVVMLKRERRYQDNRQNA
jgi:spoIIIJ-associated protein